MSLMTFIKGKNGWEINRPSSNAEKSTIFMDNILAKMKDHPDDQYVAVVVASGRLGHDNKRIAAMGYNGMVKQVETVGGCSYVCPTYEGEYVNEHLWIGDAVKEVLGEFPEVIYFKKY